LEAVPPADRLSAAWVLAPPSTMSASPSWSTSPNDG
jgi:hypothetical protein